MTTTQLEMPLRRKARTAEERAGDVVTILAYLKGRGWVCRRVIERETGIPDRDIRAVAEHCDDILSGNLGYRLLAEATGEEVRAFLHRFDGQIEKMTARRIRIGNKAHGRIAQALRKQKISPSAILSRK